jgi:glycogenin glucosyltransferase
MPWDATRAPPPSGSKPEAANFPSTHYTFETERKQFKAPEEYPKPPTDMWYSVPDSRPQTPVAPIFPWEKQTHRPKTTRIFSEDYPQSPQLDHNIGSPQSTWEDNAGGMEQYIKSIMTTTAEKGKAGIPVEERGESLVFTGFPDPIDRPSLPVTPAPTRTKTSWLDEDEDDDKIAAATEAPKELPKQAEWVCPKCGFLSHDSTAFTSSSSPVPVPVPLPKIASAQLLSSEPSPEPSPSPRPTPPHRHSSSDMSGISGTSTVVPIEAPAEVPKAPLPPPAWLTGAVTDDDDASLL